MSIELSPSVQAWRDRGRFIRVAGLEVFVVDHRADGSPPAEEAVHGLEPEETVVLLHGFPSSSYDWRHVVPRLGGRRVVLIDLPGYGLSEKPVEYSYSLMEQADVVELALRELGVATAHVVAHDMGTSVACELMARRERGLLTFHTRTLTLMNGSVHLELAHLTPSQKLLRSPVGPAFARLSSERVFKAQLRRILARPVDELELDDMWAQLDWRDGRRRLPQSISYLDERMRFWHRWIGALTRLDLPAMVLWGTEDPVAVLAIALQLATEIPGARFERLEGVGHYPQLEDPATVAAALVRFLESVAR